MAIPRILHRIWVGPEEMPADFAAFGERWASLHPEWEHRLWTDENLPADVQRPEVLDQNRIPAERADVLRYELLWRYGGVYVDADMEPLKPLDDLMGGEFFIGDLKPGRINNAVIGSAPGHPIMETAMREARFMVYDDPRQAPVDEIKVSTGPLFLAGVVERFSDVHTLPPAAFYPTQDAELETAYARHHTARTWVAFDPEQRARVLVERQLEKTESKLRKTEVRAAKLEDRVERLRADRDDLRARIEALQGTWYGKLALRRARRKR